MRRRLGWGDSEIIALHSGNMGLKQGLDNIIATARLATEKDLPIRFVLMGDGSQRQYLEDLGRGITNLQFLPSAGTEEFPSVLAAADVLLVNERSSAVGMSLPSKLTSYFWAGIPVLAAVPASGGTATEVQRSGGGIVVEPDSPALLLDALLDLRSDPHERARLGMAGAAHAKDHLSPDVSLEGIASSIVAATVSDL